MFRVLAQEGGPLEVIFGSFENTVALGVLGISLVALVFAWYLCAPCWPLPKAPRR